MVAWLGDTSLINAAIILASDDSSLVIRAAAQREVVEYDTTDKFLFGHVQY
jgi:hypothetical protein